MDFDNRAPVPEAAQPTFNDDVPMGAPPIPPDCAAKAFPYLTAADAIRRRRCAPVGEGSTPEGEIDEVDLEELGPWPDEDDEDDEEPLEDDFLEVVCPSCGETIYFDEDMLDSEDGLICPNCNEPVEIHVCDGECGCCDEDCGTDDEE